MRSIPVDEVVKLAEYFVNQDWPLTREQGYAACEALGWPAAGKGMFRMPYGVQHVDEASVFVGKEEQGVAEVEFWLTDVVRDPSEERDTFMNDVFSSCVTRFRDLWGKGKIKRTKEDHEARWSTPNGCHVTLVNNWKAITFTLLSPSYAKTLKSLGNL